MTAETSRDSRPGKRVAILQSNYIPWKGYFDIIRSVDEFVLYDEVQYTRRDWRNRNKIKTAGGLQWLTIPVLVKGNYHQSVLETRIENASWAAGHWKTLCHTYGKAPFFREFKDELEAAYQGATSLSLSEINAHFLQVLCRLLQIRTPITWSHHYERSAADKSERLLEICQRAGATEYLSGPAAKDYLDTELFTRAGVGVAWMDYSHYAEYPQLHPPFEHGVTILDALFMVGPTFLQTLQSSLQRSGHAA